LGRSVRKGERGKEEIRRVTGKGLNGIEAKKGGEKERKCEGGRRRGKVIEKWMIF